MATYETHGKSLEVVSTVFRGEVNDCIVCRDLNSIEQNKYLVLAVRDRECVKKLLKVLDDSPYEEPPYLFSFTKNEEMLFVFPYRIDRPFESFSEGQAINPQTSEQICLALVLECLSCEIPYPLLYLILDQGLVQITKDNLVYFGNSINLEDLDEEKNERDCAVRCARLVIDFLTRTSKKPLKSCELIRKKCKTHSYSNFSEIYRDIKLTEIPDKKPKFLKRIKAFWIRNKDTFFKIFLVLCIVVSIFALLMLISQLIFGDMAFLRLFKKCFETIGTENLR